MTRPTPSSFVGFQEGPNLVVMFGQTSGTTLRDPALLDRHKVKTPYTNLRFKYSDGWVVQTRIKPLHCHS